jgi:hypothetical protein
VATFITLLLVPVLYSIFVLDLKIIRWETKPIPVEIETRPTVDLAPHTNSCGEVSAD